jgi:serine/threonine protein kinase
MLKLLTCLRGHFWEAAGEDETALQPATCPECGGAPESLPLLDLAPSDEAPPPPPPAPPPPLQDAHGLPVVAGYDVLEEVGRGPTGVAFYRARQALLNRTVLLKVVFARDDVGQRAWGCLRGESSALGRLQHPHVVQIHEAGERDRQLFYNVVEHVAGPTLGPFVADKPLPFSQAARLVEVLALALDHAHEQGVVHRNLKPGSVLLQPLDTHAEARRVEEGGAKGARKPPAEPPGACLLYRFRYVPKLTDFGLARKPVEGDINDLELYGDDAGFLSPEQAWGRSKEIGLAADVYGLGGLLYFLLTGVPPFRGRDAQETVEAIQTQKLLPPAQLRARVPADLDVICRRCLAPAPARRYASAGELAAELARFREGQPIQGRPISNAQRFLRWARRRPAAVALLGVAFLGVVAGLVSYGAGQAEVAQLHRDLRNAQLNADAARAEAADARARLQKLHEQVRFDGYRQAFRRANELLRLGDEHGARAVLEGCARDQRHWEWYYLQGRLRREKEAVLPNAPGPVVALAFRPGGRDLAVAWGPRDGGAPMARGQVRLYNLEPSIPKEWRLERLKEWLTLADFDGPVHALAFQPNGGPLLTASGDAAGDGSELRVWALDRWNPGRVVRRKPFPNARVTGLAFSRDGSYLVLAEEPDRLYKLSAINLERLFGPFGERPDRFNRRVTQVAVSGDGRYIASCTPEGLDVDIWDAASGRSWGAIGREARAVAFGAGSTLAILDRNDTLSIWNVAASGRGVGRPTQELDSLRGAKQLAFSADGRRLAVAGEDGGARVWGWSGTRWEEVYTLPQARGNAGLAFSSDNRALATASGSEVRVWGWPEG